MLTQITSLLGLKTAPARPPSEAEGADHQSFEDVFSEAKSGTANDAPLEETGDAIAEKESVEAPEGGKAAPKADEANSDDVQKTVRNDVLTRDALIPPDHDSHTRAKDAAQSIQTAPTDTARTEKNGLKTATEVATTSHAASTAATGASNVKRAMILLSSGSGKKGPSRTISAQPAPDKQFGLKDQDALKSEWKDLRTALPKAAPPPKPESDIAPIKPESEITGEISVAKPDYPKITPPLPVQPPAVEEAVHSDALNSEPVEIIFESDIEAEPALDADAQVIGEPAAEVAPPAVVSPEDIESQAMYQISIPAMQPTDPAAEEDGLADLDVMLSQLGMTGSAPQPGGTKNKIVATPPQPVSHPQGLANNAVSDVPGDLPVGDEDLWSLDDMLRPENTSNKAATGTQLAENAAATVTKPAMSPEMRAQTRQSSPVFADADTPETDRVEVSLISGAHSQRVDGAGQMPAAQMARADGAMVMRQISEAFQRMTDGRIEIRLSPEELGSVRMQMHQAEGGLTVTIQAERPETLDLMRRNIDQLARDLADAGYDGASFSFEHQGEQGQPSDLGLASEANGEPDDGAQNPSVSLRLGDGLDILV